MLEPSPPFPSAAVRLAFQNAENCGALLHLRTLIFETAKTLGVGPISETLKWGQASYVPTTPKTGTAVRLGIPKTGGIGMYVHCQTDIIGPLSAVFPPTVQLDKTRGILFPDQIDDPAATALIRAAFTYYL
ncbi:MAG: DUF1801 domain-containing protein [Planktomarina sp.]